MMKRTAVISGFIALAMMFTMGLSSPINQNMCSVYSTAPYLIMIDHQFYDGLVIYNELAIGQPADVTDQVRPEQHGVESLQLRKRGTLDAARPTQANFVEQVMIVAEEIDPELAEQCRAICESNPEALELIIRRVGHRFNSLNRLRDSDPELFDTKVSELKLDMEIYQFTEQLHRHFSDSADLDAQIAQLRGLVRKKTKLAIRAQAIYINRLENHLDGLRMRLKKTNEHINEIVERRVQQLIQIDLDDAHTEELHTD